jgi:type III polyketide synthase
MDLTTPPSVSEVAELFRAEGVPLAVAASRNAVDEAGIAFEDITHVVATTCTTSSNPGFDCYVAQELGLRPDIERVLLHGVGCAGGLAALRLAASLCQSAAWRDEPAHVLVVACEITSSMRRAELEKISREQKVRVGITLFGDGSSALVLSLDYGPSPDGVDGNTSKRDKGIYELVNWAHLTVPDTYSDLRVEVTSTGEYSQACANFRCVLIFRGV